MAKQNRHHLQNEEISRYLDNELNHARHADVKQHLKNCTQCRHTYHQMLLLQKVARQQNRLSVPGAIWDNVNQAIRQSHPPVNKSILQQKFRKLSTAALLLISILLGSLLYTHTGNHGFFAGCSMIETTKDTTAIDYGLYLAGLSQPSVMEQFNKKYNRQSIPINQILRDEAYKKLTPPWGNLSAELNNAFVLSSDCCNSFQINLRLPEGRITLFRQPNDHPLKLSGYQTNKATIDSTECTKIETDQHKALMFHTRKSQYVLVGDKDDPMLTAIFSQLANTP